MCATLGSETGLHLHHRKVFSFTAAPAMGNRTAKWSVVMAVAKVNAMMIFNKRVFIKTPDLIPHP